MLERKYKAPSVNPVVVIFPSEKVTVPDAPDVIADGAKPTAAFASVFASAFITVPDALIYTRSPAPMFSPAVYVSVDVVGRS